MSGKADKVVRVVTGVVVEDGCEKTVRVRVERRTIHPLYGKVLRRRAHFLAHDENDSCKVGDVVTLRESPRFSKRKSWVVVGPAAGQS